MRWKLFTLLAVLALMVSTASPVKVKAQGLVEYALILVLVAVGPDEIAGIHWLPGNNHGNPQVPRIAPGATVTWTYRVTNTGDSTCTQTISSSVVANDGVNTLNVSISGGEFFIINGEKVETLLPCFATGGNRNAIAVGRPFPRGLAAQGAADPNALAYKLQNVQITAWNVSGSADGATRANGMTISRTPGDFDVHGLGEKKAHILLMAGLGMGERVEGYYLLLKPLSHGTTRPSEPPIAGVSLDLLVSGPSNASGNGTCTETVEVALDALPVINFLNVQMGAGYDSILVNGEEVDLPNKCLMDKSRVVVTVAEPVAVDRVFDAELGIQKVRRFLGYSIVEFLTGKTRAASIGIDLPQKFLVFEDRMGEP